MTSVASKLGMSPFSNSSSAILRRGTDLDVLAGFDNPDRASPDGAKTGISNLDASDCSKESKEKARRN